MEKGLGWVGRCRKKRSGEPRSDWCVAGGEGRRWKAGKVSPILQAWGALNFVQGCSAPKGGAQHGCIWGAHGQLWGPPSNELLVGGGRVLILCQFLWSSSQSTWGGSGHRAR